MPKALRTDHVSIAVKSIEEALEFFIELFDVKREKVRYFGGSGDFNGAIFYIGESRIELLEPAKPDGFVARFLETRGEGVHHVTIQVKDLAAMRAKLKEMNIPTFGEPPAGRGMDNSFIHPKHAHGVLFQLEEEVYEVQPQDDD